MGLRHEVHYKIGLVDNMTGQDGPAEGRASGAAMKKLLPVRRVSDKELDIVPGKI